jgi:Carboxypeptidase regulatory-like domain/TonB-dependent Receptor Plug Domain
MTYKLKALFFLIALLVARDADAQVYTQIIKGTVLEKGIKQPLIGATVVVIDTKSGQNFGARCDENGRFRIENVPVGKHQVRITFLGFKEQTLQNVQVISGKELDLNIELEELLTNLKEAVIVAEVNKQKPLNSLSTVSARTFSVEETQRFAAAVNDPGRMATAYAGVTVGSDGNNTIFVRGNSSNGLLWRMEGVEIPNPNHFSAVGTSGGGISILSAQLLSNSDFLTGAFAAEYGNAISGVFDMRLRKGNDHKREYTVQLGVLGLDVATEGPIKLGSQTGSYLINYRYSTLSGLSKLGVNLGSAVTNFQDVSFNFSLPTRRAGAFTLFGIGGLSGQTLPGFADSLQWKDDIDKRYKVDYLANTGVIGMTHGLTFGSKTHLKTVAAFSGTRNMSKVSEYQSDYALRKINDQKHDQTKLTLSSVLSHKFSPRHYLRTGAFVNLHAFQLNQANWSDTNESLTQEIKQDGNLQSLNAFAQWQYRPSEKITLNTGVHSYLFFLNNNYSVEPRAAIKYAISEKRSLSFGYGLHSQMQPLGIYFTQNKLATGGTQNLPNQNLGLTKAHHFVVGFDQNLSKNLHFKAEAYYQRLNGIPVHRDSSSSFSLINVLGDYPSFELENKGIGRNQGVEITFEKFLSRGSYFMFSSSLYDSKYKGSDGIWRNTRYNLGYANSLVAGKEWNWNRGRKNRTFGLNLKLTQMGGLRETPLDLAASIAAGETVRDDSRAFENQFPAYFRLDTGVRIKRNYESVTTTLSLDIQNATNRQNILTQYYDPNTFEKKYFYQVPLLPILAYKVEF